MRSERGAGLWDSFGVIYHKQSEWKQTISEAPHPSATEGNVQLVAPAGLE